MLLWLLLACASAPPPDASAIPYGDGTVADALDALQTAQAEEKPPPPVDYSAQIRFLDERLARVELAVAQMQQQGVMPATQVGFNSALSSLDARNTQEAIDALAKRLKEIEDRTGQDMGQPGPGLFAIPSSSRSQQGQGQRGGQGSQGGGGQGGGGQGGGGQGGGGQGGGGQGGGGQGGGGQGGGGSGGR